jgi:hypothetical protein
MTRRSLEHESRSYRQQIEPPPYATKRLMEDISPSVRVEDWEALKIGNRVLTQRPGDIARVGTVEDISDDASVIWVRLDALGRILITRDDDVTFCKIYRH